MEAGATGAIGAGAAARSRCGGVTMRGDSVRSSRSRMCWFSLRNPLPRSRRCARPRPQGRYGALCHDLIDAGRHHRNPDDAVKAFVEGRADDDVGVLIDLLADAGGGFVDFVEREVAAAGDRDQQAPGALHRHVVDQRIGDRRFGGRERALVAVGFAGAHHGLAHLAHDGADVGEVEIDEAFLDHQVGDAGDAGIEHLVGHREGVGEGGLLVGDPEQILVRE